MRVIGLMSGTSYDAIDAAAADLHLDGSDLVLRPLGTVTEAYDPGLREALAAALPPAATTLAEVCRLDTLIGQAFAAAAVRAQHELCDGRAELIASHGQTVFHWTDEGQVRGTLQIGQPAWIAEATGLPVVADFRPRDIAAGGQGAPLVSLVDLMWLRGRPGTPVALNLGGIANVTAPDGTAFDAGPAGALIDAAVRRATGRAFDADGELAARGIVHEPLLRRLLDEPYYARPAPKTTGKELFHEGYLLAALADCAPSADEDVTLTDEDVIATLTRLTARTVADAVRGLGATGPSVASRSPHAPGPPHAPDGRHVTDGPHVTEVIASGGGTRNPVLMAMLGEELAGVPLRLSDGLGLPAAAKEAYAFAVLGFLTAHGLPGTDPRSTGARHAGVLGSLTPGRSGFPRIRAGAERPVRLVLK
ncbi:anhydro-N-acetylmuramic acid kinase [Streptomyces sp. BH-SS-21]|uniref:Anhydro-N-acetylmuramic acid kinase n=1 Tax=Streptomyces liliiviolaceus TaxID=2823109 RepID=A0A940XUI2_9ACTN|nr:anhydro-N-acetylmuramic acid kinase [Streptomyces liliiviolaceus]MBQ0852154.1 anhydro-N-acetylmuramic acid kinase [Streptomyces liliiviolaceus]